MKSKPCFSLLQLLVLLFPLFAWSNGGPIDGSSYYSSGRIELRNQKDIRLTAEVLSIKISGDQSLVNVSYVLENMGEAGSVTYAFPVDQAPDQCEDCSPGDEFFSDFKMWDGETLLKAAKSEEVEVMEGKRLSHNGKELRFRLERTWMVTELKFQKGEQKKLKVQYKVTNSLSDWETSKDFFPSYSDRTFMYDFSPAGYWAEDPAAVIEVEIDGRAVVKNLDKIRAESSSMSFSEGEDGYFKAKVSGTNVKEIKPLTISYEVSNYKFSKVISGLDKKPKGLKAEATSTLRGNYQASNLIDGDFNTAWVEGKSGSGVGESVTLRCEAFPLVAVVMYGGYTKDKKTYTTNNRVKRVRLEFILAEGKDNYFKPGPEEIELQDLPFQEIGDDNCGKLAQVLYSFGDGSVWIEGVKITILEVYKGSKYDDTCLSELILFPNSWEW